MLASRSGHTCSGRAGGRCLNVEGMEKAFRRLFTTFAWRKRLVTSSKLTNRLYTAYAYSYYEFSGLHRDPGWIMHPFHEERWAKNVERRYDWYFLLFYNRFENFFLVYETRGYKKFSTNWILTISQRVERKFVLMNHAKFLKGYSIELDLIPKKIWKPAGTYLIQEPRMRICSRFVQLQLHNSRAVYILHAPWMIVRNILDV